MYLRVDDVRVTMAPPTHPFFGRRRSVLPLFSFPAALLLKFKFLSFFWNYNDKSMSFAVNLFQVLHKIRSYTSMSIVAKHTYFFKRCDISIRKRVVFDTNSR